MFDGLSASEIALDRPSAKALSHILRHRELWPKGFEWNYARCDRCAIGLAGSLWKACQYDRVLTNDSFGSLGIAIGKTIGFSPAVAKYIFYDLDVEFSESRECITPENVADIIDRYLAKSEESSDV